MSPLDFIAKLAALAPRPRVNLTRFHGVFAPESKHRRHVTPAQRGKGNPAQSQVEKTPEQRHLAMSWAQYLKRVFHIDVSICPTCRDKARVLAIIEDQAVIDKIRNHQKTKWVLLRRPGCFLQRGLRRIRTGLPRDQIFGLPSSNNHSNLNRTGDKKTEMTFKLVKKLKANCDMSGEKLDRFNPLFLQYHPCTV